MQTELENRVHIDSTVSPIDNIGTSTTIDRTASNYRDIKNKVKKSDS